jgi:hypothetical protein
MPVVTVGVALNATGKVTVPLVAEAVVPYWTIKGDCADKVDNPPTAFM